MCGTQLSAEKEVISINVYIRKGEKSKIIYLSPYLRKLRDQEQIKFEVKGGK